MGLKDKWPNLWRRRPDLADAGVGTILGLPKVANDARLRQNLQVDLKDKWRNLCKMRPELSEVGMGDGMLPGGKMFV